MNAPNPMLCSLFVILSSVMAGIVQTLWLKCAFSNRFAIPLDGGRTFRGKRIFGDNKTLRGFVVMIPAAAVSFFVARAIFGLSDKLSQGLWELPLGAYFLLGGWAGFGFMLGELPNSFVKRQLRIEPGAAPYHPIARMICFVIDQIDSIIGAMLAISVFVPLPLISWICVLLIGALVHWGFNLVFMLIGLKVRAA